MKKRVFAIAALSAVMAVSSIPVYASEIEPAVQGNGYKVYVGQGIGSLQETMETLGINIGFGGGFCPENQQPGAENPDVEVSEQPEMDEPVQPEQPDMEIPIRPEQPEIEKPETDGSDDADILHEYARRVVDLVNEERAKAGLSEMKLDMDVTAAADVRAREIKQSFSHTRPDGSSFSTVLQQQGVSYRGCGENIAWGQRTPEQVMNGWMNSEGHRANILNKNYKNIGVGFYQENGVNYWVQLFTY